MVEPVRLVIWDLDDTFWKGTLTEGGHRYQQHTHDIVVELARRGIMSTICSKNDHAEVEPILRESGIWDYFIFPSIDWTSKGPRIRDMIETIGLRPPTVMLIDDNPQNLNEALYFTPEMQVASEGIIPDILGSPLFAGKDDHALTRLAQYKALERRRSDELATGDDNREFLRSSNLRVSIVHDIEGNIDRVIELINRTNQLNFTKRRLSEDPQKARAEVLDMFSGFVMQGGLVHVQDNYGDYGLCGFYAVNTIDREMRHYCFSCRILNMGVERWLYDRLGRPRVQVVGEVLTDLSALADPVDWIAFGSGEAGNRANRPAHQFDTVLVRGGCELQLIAHYLGLSARVVHGEYFAIRHGLAIRTDHSLALRHAIDGIAPAAVAALMPLGYVAEDFASRLSGPLDDVDYLLLSFWQNGNHAVFRHTSLNTFITFEAPLTDNAQNILDLPEEILDARLQGPFAREAVRYLRRNFELVSGPDVRILREDALRMLALVPANRPVFILLQLEQAGALPIPHHISTNDVWREVSKGRLNVILLRLEDYIHREAEIFDSVHFKPQVYFRIAQAIQTIAIGLLGRTQSRTELEAGLVAG